MDILSALLSIFGGIGSVINVMSGLIQFLITLWGLLGPVITSLLA